MSLKEFLHQYVDMSDINVNLNITYSWLVQVRNHLDKIEKEYAKTKWKILGSLSRNYYIKRTVFQRFDEYLIHFQFKSDFLSY